MHNRKLIIILNHNIRKWGVKDNQFFTHPTQERYISYQVNNNNFIEKGYSFKKIYCKSNYYNII